MAVVNVEVRSTLSPAEVLTVLTDFSERRAEAWPGVDLEHLVVHETGADFAEVTEGNSTTWERERYEWDSASGTVTAKTLRLERLGRGQSLGLPDHPGGRRLPGRGPAGAARQEPQGQADRRPAAGGGQEGRHRQPGQRPEAGLSTS